MRVYSRLLLILIFLAAVTLFQEFQVRDVSASRINEAAQLRRPIELFPLRIGDWSGFDVEDTRPEFLYGDSHLHRSYRNSTTGQSVTLWLAHSSVGEDRFHHPEVCMPASGHREVLELRRGISMDTTAGDHPGQHFVYEKMVDLRRVHVAYWHYELSGSTRRPTPFRNSGLRHVPLAPSVSVELFAHDLAPGDSLAVEELARRIDVLLQGFLPDTAIRGSHRSSFMMVRDAQLMEG